MICKDISHLNRRRRRAASRRKAVQGVSPCKRPTGQQVDAHLRACTQYIVNVDGKTITLQVAKLERNVQVAAYAVDADVAIDDLLETTPGEKVGQFGCRNLLGRDVGAWQRQMTATMSMCPGGEDPLDHYVLSWQADEEPTPKQLERAVDIVLHVMGLSEHQTVFGSHINTANYHLHMAINRIHPVTFKRAQAGHGRPIYALHQAIAVIEYEQSWASNEHALFQADDLGVFHRASGARVRDINGPIPFLMPSDRNRDRDMAQAEFAAMTRLLSEGARLYERRTGEWSFERRVKVFAGPIIRAAQSSDEMHADLAEEGIGFERRGSGAVLTMGGRAIAATTAWRGASIANLEKRWEPGTYGERPSDAHYDPCTPRRLRIEEYKRHEDYVQERELRRAARDTRKAEIYKSCDTALRAVDDQAATSFADIDRHDWTGRGDELNVARAIVGAGKAAARAGIMSAISEALANLRASDRFPTFVRWNPGLTLPPLDEVAASQSAALTSRSHDSPAVPYLLRHHVGIQIGRECHYRDDRGRVAFRDLGSIILIDRATDLAAVRDALRLASTKWDRSHIVATGDRAFLKLVALAAVDLNVEVKNPAVEKEMNRLRIAAAVEVERERTKRIAVEREIARLASATVSRRGSRPASDWSPAPPVVAVPRGLSEEGRPSYEHDKKRADHQRELQDLKALSQLCGSIPSLDIWVDARLSSPENLTLHRALASAIMQDELGRQAQAMLVAEGYAVGPIIASQARMFGRSSRPPAPDLAPVAGLSTPDKVAGTSGGRPTAPKLPSSMENTYRLALLHRRFNSIDWDPTDYSAAADEGVIRATDAAIKGDLPAIGSATDVGNASSVTQAARHRLASDLQLKAQR